MPEHVHLLVFPLPNGSQIEHLLRAIKRPYSFRIKQRLLQHRSPLLRRLTVHQRPGVSTFRYWQEGPGYDRNLYKQEAVLAAMDYIHENPVRRKLATIARDWRWSSAKFYETGEQPGPALPTLTRLPAEWFFTQ